MMTCPAALEAAFESAVRDAARPGGPRWLALRVETSAQADADAAPAIHRGIDRELPGAERFYWECPAEARAVVGVGALEAVEVAGEGRFEEAAREARELFSGVRVLGSEGPALAGPLLVGGFAFDSRLGAAIGDEAPGWEGFGSGRLVLPRLLFVRAGPRSWCTAIRRLSAGADVRREWQALCAGISELKAAMRAPRAGARAGDSQPGSATLAAPAYRASADASHAHYRGRVRAALQAIATGDLEKVVVARSIRLHCEGGFDCRSLLATLGRAYPSCVTFAIARRGAEWLGATPERLAALEGDRVSTCALAGSAPRGRSPERDARIGRELRESKKEQTEHAIVVRAIRESLRDLCGELDGPETPRLLRMEGIQHLETPLSGRLKAVEERGASPSVLDLVARLHPTPAICGSPRESARRWIETNEGLDRGWYAGPIGFVDAEGGGEFRVALRAALVAGREARLYAGSGIVLGSDPDCELRETRLKLSALLAPMLEI